MKRFIELYHDKILHFLASGYGFFVLMIIFKEYDIAITASLILFFGKEVYDENFGSGFDIKDALASLAGVVVSVVLYDVFVYNNYFN